MNKADQSSKIREILYKENGVFKLMTGYKMRNSIIRALNTLKARGIITEFKMKKED